MSSQMHISLSGHRLFQGVRTGKIEWVPIGQELVLTELPAADETVTVTLYEMGMARRNLTIKLVVGDPCTIDLSSLPERTRSEWKLVAIAEQRTSDILRYLWDVPSYAGEASSVEFQGLTYASVRNTRVQPDGQGGGRHKAGQDIIYTAYFVKRAEDASLSCLSLVNSNDVAFVFPFENAPGPRVLWANKARLAAQSSYFASLVFGGFEESGKALTGTSKALEALEQELADVVAVERSKNLKESTQADESSKEAEGCNNDEVRSNLDNREEVDGSPSIISYIVIRDTPYSTYRALFKWFETQEIIFAKLDSTDSTISQPTSGVSPTAIYRLCDQVGIEELKALALDDFKSQLSPTNVVYQLFSMDCFCYHELRRAALMVLHRNWGLIRDGGGLDTLAKIVKQEGSDTKEMMEVAIDILRRL